MSAAAALPGSLAAGAKKLVPSQALAPAAAQSAAAPARVAAQPARAAAAPSLPFFFQAAPLTLETFAADCTTPKSEWNLGETVCVKVNGTTQASRVQLVNPQGYAIARADIGFGAQTVTFALPSDNALTEGADSFDNRGTWRIALIYLYDASTALSVPIVVHDDNETVANVQVVKSLITGQAVAGANVSAVIRVYNTGPDAAAGVKFTDVTPANTTFQSLVQTAGPSFACTTPAVDATGTSECTLASLGRDVAADFVVTYKVNGSIANATDLTTTASVETTTTETAAADNGSSDSTNGTNPNPPSCTLSCPANITVDNDPGLAGANVNYPDATASAGCGTLTTNHPEDPQTGTAFFPIGTTTVTLTAGNGSECSFLVTVLDKRALTITLNGSADITVNCGASFTDPGATASDGTNSVPVTAVVTVPNGQVDGNGDPIMVTVPSVNTNAPGDYTITYTATKDSNTVTATRVVHVVASSPPVITLAGTAGYTPQTVQVTDTDDNGNPVVVTETILVKTIECHSAFTPPTATAVSGCGNTPVPVTTTGAVDPNTVGTYEVVYSAVDNAGNDADTRIRVTVVDTTGPAITLNGGNTTTVECHTSFTDPGASAEDACEGPVSVSASGSVNPNVVGTYFINYTATDSGGRTTTATRTVNVVDTTAPVVTLNGPATVSVILGSSFTDPGATASDSCDASVAVSVSGAVNTNAIGTYTLTYSATDDSNNTGTATRTVYVIYNFSGFFSPVSNTQTINQVNAGRSIPVKFSLAGNQGLGIMAAGSPYSQQVSCGSTTPVDLEETGTAGNSSLTYDASTDRYNYVWKTESSWAGTCRVLTVALIDGTTHTAYFKFK